VPLALGGTETGGLFYYPLALTVMGGLMSSSILTLTVLPWVNVRIEGIARWMRSLWARSAPASRSVSASAPSGEAVEAAG
jgi:hypothetical protein